MIAAVSACQAALSGCIYLPADAGYSGPEPMPEEVAAPFEYAESPTEFTSRVLDETDRYVLRRIEFSPTVNLVGDHQVVIDYYDLPGEEVVPAVIVLPILGGKNRIANHFARVFASHGLAALIVHRQETFKDAASLEELNLTFRQIVIDHRQAVDWIQTRSDLDHDRIGLFGVSAGAIKGALVYALEDRIDAAVLGLVAGDLPYILAFSTEKGIVKLRRKIMEEHDVTRDELHAALREEFEHDPLRYARHMDARNVLMFMGLFDSVVPCSKGMELRRAMGDPPAVIIPTGHYTALLYLPMLEQKSIRFLKRRLTRPPPVTAGD
jgi:dienelactone hydrolase